jgi:hypothetical protein
MHAPKDANCFPKVFWVKKKAIMMLKEKISPIHNPSKLSLSQNVITQYICFEI